MPTTLRHIAAICLTAGGIVLAGCGGEPQPPADSTAVAPPAAAPPAVAPVPETPPAAAMPITGKTHEVRMVGDAKGYRFEPASLTIKPGDGVRWTMVTGGPHNVSFWADSIPSGAVAVLNGAMAKPISPLAGPLLMQPNETYTISFAGAPAGTYHYFCTPHLAMAMKATITVQ